MPQQSESNNPASEQWEIIPVEVTKGEKMCPLTPAEKQKAYRERQKLKRGVNIPQSSVNNATISRVEIGRRGSSLKPIGANTNEDAPEVTPPSVNGALTHSNAPIMPPNALLMKTLAKLESGRGIIDTKKSKLWSLFKDILHDLDHGI